MKIIIDSNILIALKVNDEKLNNKSKNIIKAFLEGKIKEIHITDYVLVETVNFLLKKTNFEATMEIYELLMKKANITYVNEVMLEKIDELFKKYRDLSITDCSLIALSSKENIKEIYSFDSGFDKVRGIVRKEDI